MIEILAITLQPFRENESYPTTSRNTSRVTLSAQVLALDLPPGLKSRCINRLSFHSRVPQPDFTEVRETKRRREEKKVSTQPVLVAILPRVPLLAGTSDGGHEDRSLPRVWENYPLFASRHARSLPFSRLARRESTACFSESNPWFEATTLPRYPCSWTAAAPPSRSLSFLPRYFSLELPLALASFPLHICFSLSLLSFRSSPIFLRILSQLCLTICLAPASHILSFSFYTPLSSCSQDSTPETLSSSTYTQFRVTSSCPSMAAGIGPIANFCGHENKFS